MSYSEFEGDCAGPRARWGAGRTDATTPWPQSWDATLWPSWWRLLSLNDKCSCQSCSCSDGSDDPVVLSRAFVARSSSYKRSCWLTRQNSSYLRMNTLNLEAAEEFCEPPPWGKTLNMLEGLHKLTAVLIQTWISSWKEIHVLWMSLHSVCLLLSIVVSLRRERKTTSGIGVCQRNLKNVTVFSNVSWIYHLGGDSASGLYPSSVHKHPPPSLPPSTRLNDYPLLT